MPQRESGTTRASMSHTIAFLNAPRIFATLCFAGLTMCDSIRKRSKACSIPFFKIDVELFMRTYIVTDMDEAVRAAKATGADVSVAPFDDPIGRDTIIQWPGGVNTQLY